MPNTPNQKDALLELISIMKEKTDETHGLTLAEIAKELEKAGYSVSRKTLYADLKLLTEHGMPVELLSSGVGVKNVVRYHRVPGDGEMQPVEWKLLADAVQSSRFITEKKSREIIGKIQRMTSEYQASELRKQIFVQGRSKSINETILYTVDALSRAIREDLKISFSYFNWNARKEKEYHRDGKPLLVNPWGLVWSDENYYLIASYPGEDVLRHFRVDKIEKIRETKERRDASEEFRSLDAGVYTNSTFGMFSGEAKAVTLDVASEFAGVIIDRFGRNLLFRDQKNGRFLTTVRVIPSPLFYGWALSFGDRIRVAGPPDVVRDWKKQACDAIGLPLPEEDAPQKT